MELTKAEDQIMQILWKIEKGFVKDILEHFEEPKPAYTTVATMVKILEKKGFVTHKTYGNAHQFCPKISKEEYSKNHVNSLFRNYFKNSIKDVVSFFANNNQVNVNDIDNAIELLNEIKNKKS
ncbi:MAG: BlaI/MecI/CopY family transcriptional regulator [Bacteroidales bacterium]|nr:BlaI/MecI/CopY family transcriptional regulator [Bacteroidales bacterium]